MGVEGKKFASEKTERSGNQELRMRRERMKAK
jgi:hypothetical protein